MLLGWGVGVVAGRKLERSLTATRQLRQSSGPACLLIRVNSGVIRCLGDLPKGVLESADGTLRLRVFLRAREDGAKGAAMVSGQGTPAQDWFERV